MGHGKEETGLVFEIIWETGVGYIDRNYQLITLFFTVVMLIYRYVEIIGKILLTPFFFTYTIMKKIQVNQLIYIYNHY